MKRNDLIFLLLILVFGACGVQSKALNDPLTELVPLPAAGEWEARLLWASDSGVWTVELVDVLPRSAGPEITALDDRGRCALLSLNATKVSYWQPVMDGFWLGGIAHEEIDQGVEGPELYVGGKRGNLYQIVPLPQGGFDSRVIAYFPGKEIHTLVAADLNPSLVGRELYAGLISGELFRLDPPGKAGDAWKMELVYKDPGRIRDAVVFKEGDSEVMVYVSRSGRVVRIEHHGELKGVELYRCPQGLARIDRNREASVFYVVGDDGQVIRLEKGKKEMVYAGPLGARGIAAGRFFKDPAQEGLALFGYSGEVEILKRTGSGEWISEKVFKDLDKGHWLAAGELDDRNTTDEIVISGYGARVVLLSRPPGFGLERTP